MRDGNAPSLVELEPQEEEVDADGVQVCARACGVGC
jgi:hypothetical protein